MKKINWNIAKFESKRELVSSDMRWHVSEKQKPDGARELFLINYDLLLAPSGSGANHKECFETFIENCERYIERIHNIQQEVKEYMEAMLEATKEHRRCTGCLKTLKAISGNTNLNMQKKLTFF